MTEARTDRRAGVAARKLASMKETHRRTLEAIFHRPAPRSLEWRELIGLVESVGDFYEKSDNEFVFEVGGARHLMHRHHAEDLTSAEVIDIRHFLARAGLSPAPPSPRGV